MPCSCIWEICSRPRLTSASPVPQPTSRILLPGRGRSVSARNSVKSSFHQRSRRSFSVADLNPSIGAIMKSARAWTAAASIGDGELAGNDRTSAREHTEACEIRDEGQGADKDKKLQHVARRTSGHHLPEQPQNRMGDGDRPHGSVEVPTFMAFTPG